MLLIFSIEIALFLQAIFPKVYVNLKTNKFYYMTGIESKNLYSFKDFLYSHRDYTYKSINNQKKNHFDI